MTIQCRLEIGLWGRYVPGVGLRRRNLAQAQKGRLESAPGSRVHFNLGASSLWPVSRPHHSVGSDDAQGLSIARTPV